MDIDSPRWGIVGVAFTVVLGIAGFILALLSISNSSTRTAGIIICVVSLLLLALIFLRLQAAKKIVYEVVADTEVATINEEMKGKVELLFNGVTINDARLLVVKLSNGGGVIPSSLYEGPFIFSFGEKAEVLEAVATHSNPPALKNSAVVTVGTTTVEVKPLLLNKGDWLRFTFLVSHKQEEISLSARIHGVEPVFLNELRKQRVAVLQKVYKITSRARMLFMLFAVIDIGGAALIDRYNKGFFKSNPTYQSTYIEIFVISASLFLLLMLLDMLAYSLIRFNKGQL